MKKVKVTKEFRDDFAEAMKKIDEALKKTPL